MNNIDENTLTTALTLIIVAILGVTFYVVTI
jgi:hypothetical protein